MLSVIDMDRVAKADKNDLCPESGLAVSIILLIYVFLFCINAQWNVFCLQKKQS